MTVEASKELLELEQQRRSFAESKLLVCNNEVGGTTTLPQNQNKNKKQQGNGSADRKLFTTTFPTSQVLGKVKEFIGVMAEANKKLELSVEENCRSNYDIEVLSENETEFIEMDLLLGMADLKTPEAVAAAEAAIGSSRQSLPLLDGNSSSDTEDSSDEDNENVDSDRSTKCQKSDLESSSGQPKKRPKIVVLN